MAVKELMHHIKKKYPRLRVNMSMDELCGNIIRFDMTDRTAYQTLVGLKLLDALRRFHEFRKLNPAPAVSARAAAEKKKKRKEKKRKKRADRKAKQLKASSFLHASQLENSLELGLRPQT